MQGGQAATRLTKAHRVQIQARRLEFRCDRIATARIFSTYMQNGRRQGLGRRVDDAHAGDALQAAGAIRSDDAAHAARKHLEDYIRKSLYL
jgi:hypothetical protein